jgi:hypothetical protein
VGRVEGAPDQDTIFGIMGESFALWYPTGKFALLAIKAPDDSLANLPDRFLESKKDAPTEEFQVLHMGIKKWNKQIEALEWVPASRLVPTADFEATDLFENILKIDDFRAFVEGALDPSALALAPEPVKGNGDKGNKGKGGSRGTGGKDKGNGGYGGSKGSPMFFGGKGMPMAPGPMMGGMVPMPMPIQIQSGAQFISSMLPQLPAGNQSEAAQKQTCGEQLYTLVQPMAPSAFLAQKITGMLLELPMDELMLNLTDQEELRRRVAEALDVLREDGIVT